MHPILKAVSIAIRIFLLMGLFSASVSGQTVTQQWTRIFNGADNKNDVGNAIALDAAGNAFVVGQIHYATGDSDAYIAKYAAGTGALLWQKTHPGPGTGTNAFNAVAVDASGNVVATGYTNTGFGYDIYTAKYDGQTGSLIWERAYDGPEHKNDLGNAIAIDSAGNVIIGGQTTTFQTGGDFYTAKYAAATGALIWQQTYNGPSSNTEGVTAVGVDSTGNVFVTGGSPTSTGTDVYTIKYAAANGAILWSARTDGSPFGYYYSEAAGLAVDSAGNVVVTGRFTPSSGTDDIWTLKYAGSNGAIAWSRRVANLSYDAPAAIAVDGADNIFITGTSYANFSAPRRIYTAKYAAATGAVQWEAFDGSTTSGKNEALALALDPSGNPVVMGTTFGATPEDYRMIKYSAADGSVQWSFNYNGPGNVADIPHALAVDRNGYAVITGQTNNFGSSDGLNIATIKLADGPYPEAQAANQIGFTGARLNATVNPNAFPTTVSFEYGTSPTFTGAATVSIGSVGSGTAAVPVQTTLNGLSTSTTYYFRVTATGNGRTARSPIGSFATLTNTPPTLTLPSSPIIAEAASASGAVVNFTVTANDAEDGVLTPNVSRASGSVFAIGDTTVNVSATDSGSLTTTGSFTVRVRDATAPVVAAHANVNAAPASASGAIVNYAAASATDAVGVSSITYSQNSGTLFPVGTTVVTITARDAANNVGTGTFTVTVAPLTALQNWRQQYFGNPGNTGNAADNADWDLDGITNIMEFAFGTDPTSGASGPPALQYTGTFAGSGTVTAPGQPIARFEAIPFGVDFRALFARRDDYVASGLTYTVQFSADTVTWAASTATPTVLADNGTVQIVSVPYPFFVGGKKAHFFRVLITGGQ